MSDEVAGIPTGDFSSSPTSNRDVPDSSSHTADFAPKSTHDTTVHPEKSQASTSVSQAAVGVGHPESGVGAITGTASGGVESSASIADPQVTGKLLEERNQTTEAGIPSGDPSFQTSDPRSGGPSLEKSTGSRRGSRSSITGKKRNGSVVGNDFPAQAQSPEPLNTGNTTASTAVSRPERKKKGAVTKFLAKLSCCGAPEDATGIDLDEHAPPARKTSNLQSSTGRQTTPTKKPDTSAAESSTTESKEMAEIGGPPYSTLKSAGEPRIQEQPSSNTSKITANSKRSADGAVELRNAALVPTVNNTQLSTLAQSELPSSEEPREVSQQSHLQPQGASVIVEPPTPTMPSQENPTDDRTPLQVKRDSDVDMPDAPSDEPAAAEPKKGAERSDPEVVPQLPPPPPLAPRTNPSSPGHERNLTNTSSAPNEQQKWLLPPIRDEFKGKKCLVLDLDETLVHSSFKILHQADFTIPVEIEGQYHNVYVIKRPGVDQFMKRVGELYEVVVFTASVSKYGDPLLDQLDIHHVVHHRLFRESCYNHQGNYVKDLSQVGRDLRDTIIIDNSPTSYIFHPQHAVPISSWFSDAHDNELLDLIPVLEDLAGSQVRDVSLVLDVAL
ncbi:hypothetical protein MMC30_003176 [Trapelia coarctata]|nr:hypothetical protein [Trapelia coarctata]